MEYSTGQLRLCFNLRLIGSSTIHISPMVVDPKIWAFPNMVFFTCNNGYVFEKSDKIQYSIYRLIMPYQVGDKERKLSHVYTFTDDETRYAFVRKLRDDLVEFTKSGFFGYNPCARVVTYDDKWFVY
jgi:hypothetical protein